MRIKRTGVWIAGAIVVVMVTAFVWKEIHGAPANQNAPVEAASPSQSIVLTETQLKHVSVETARDHRFAEQRDALGYIDFDQERSTAISPPYPGRIRTLQVHAGQDVAAGTVLFTVESPDLIQAESALVSSAAAQALTTAVLKRDQKLFESQGVPERELDQAISDQQGADAAYRAAREAVRVFGKTDAEMDQMVTSRKPDPDMAIRAPYAGRVTALSASVGTLVQPGASPPPLVLTDIRTMWLMAAVTEADLPALHKGQIVQAKVEAYPNKRFEATISNIGETVDPTTRRILVRSDIRDPDHQLRPQMFASVSIQTGDAVASVGIPAGGVVRQGDGTMLVWTTKDRKSFTPRMVQIGLLQGGFQQILSGVEVGEQVATEGALFLSNALATASK